MKKCASGNFTTESGSGQTLYCVQGACGEYYVESSAGRECVSECPLTQKYADGLKCGQSCPHAAYNYLAKEK